MDVMAFESGEGLELLYNKQRNLSNRTIRF